MFDHIETELVARLKSRLPAHVHVLTAADLAGATEASQPVPAVHLVYQNYRVLESRNDGRASRIQQTWLAVIAVRNVRNPRSGSAARSEAVELAAQVAPTLMGFKPDAAAKPLILVNAPQASYSAGHQYLPLAFAVETTLTASA
ncbi:phage tail terminator protein [Parathalassolituus penaei]|uniref:Uncharacterized protein n=1 Tax=Parathalassolituus penaei TaxID=2997323 RepID=A0A9X3EEL0_9GAMM|nr:hypothetical protein [Parathalassolituus penaei]MCY0966132.1 hypothetical protein [Parathalassolituus penaei]